MAELIVPTRRGFLTGLGAGLICAPAIVRASSLMQVKVWRDPLFEYYALDSKFTLELYASRILNPMIENLSHAIEIDFLFNRNCKGLHFNATT